FDQVDESIDGKDHSQARKKIFQAIILPAPEALKQSLRVVLPAKCQHLKPPGRFQLTKYLGMKVSNSMAISQASSFADPEELRRRQARAARFGPSLSTSVPSPSTSTHPATLKKKESRKGQVRYGPVVGTCVVVEKDYTRSADDFDPALVRPPPVLQEALRCVKAHWAKHEDYAHACSQLKSIRQDLRVQHVEDAFAVHVR
ncbi:leukocyte receptor cluster member 8-like protein, partial [Nannochloropsis gaditana CCMP526]|uniref:leukocyte receptor cluster member 8-like protein n=1 Tax=Nannochloropsis gaditana (strain CCMP526) TaxID=1093141 RepID=UPI00029F77B1